jgi:2-isopropylmalate synthase
MARKIEIFDTTMRDGNKLPFAVLSTADRVLLAQQLERLGVDVIEAGWPGASEEEADCVRRACSVVRETAVAALARTLEGDVVTALDCLQGAHAPYLHLYMSVSPYFLAHVLKETEEKALEGIARCIRTARQAKVRVQFSLSEAPHGRREFIRDACIAARDAGAAVINLADTNGIMLPEDVAELVKDVRGFLGNEKADSPILGVHCHNDLGLATANTMAAIRAGASHVEVTVGGFGERAGNAALEEVAILLSAYGARYGVECGIRLSEIARTARLFESLTGIRAHPNKPVIGQSAFVPAAGGFSGKGLPHGLHELLQEKTIGGSLGDAAVQPLMPDMPGPYALESFNVLTSSHSPPVGVVVITRDGKTLTQTSHGNGPIDALFRAVDKALGFSTRMVLYSVSTLALGTEALTEVIVTAELRGRRFHGRFRSTDVIEASLRAYLNACNAIGISGVLELPSEFHVAGEYLWE